MIDDCHPGVRDRDMLTGYARGDGNTVSLTSATSEYAAIVSTALRDTRHYSASFRHRITGAWLWRIALSNLRDSNAFNCPRLLALINGRHDHAGGQNTPAGDSGASRQLTSNPDLSQLCHSALGSSSDQLLAGRCCCLKVRGCSASGIGWHAWHRPNRRGWALVTIRARHHFASAGTEGSFALS